MSNKSKNNTVINLSFFYLRAQGKRPRFYFTTTMQSAPSCHCSKTGRKSHTDLHHVWL